MAAATATAFVARVMTIDKVTIARMTARIITAIAIARTTTAEEVATMEEETIADAVGIVEVGATTKADRTITRTATGIMQTRTRTVCALTMDGKGISSKTAKTISELTAESPTA